MTYVCSLRARSVPKSRPVSFPCILLLASVVFRLPSVRSEGRCAQIGLDGTEMCRPPAKEVSLDETIETLMSDGNNTNHRNERSDLTMEEIDEDPMDNPPEEDAFEKMEENYVEFYDVFKTRCHDKNSSACELGAEEGKCFRDVRVQLDCPRSCRMCPDQQTPGLNRNEYLWRDAALTRKRLVDFEHRPIPEEELLDGCEDEHLLCENWANTDECEDSPGWMLRHCSASCGFCPRIVHRSHFLYDVEAEYGDAYWIYTKGKPQVSEGDGNIREQMLKTMAYIRDTVLPNADRDLVLRDCFNLHKKCEAWALHGYCESGNFKHMVHIHCAPACQTCRLNDDKK